MEEEALKNIAKQLRQPEGEEGIKIGNWMNQSNLHMNQAAIAALDIQAHDHILEIGMGNGFFVKDMLAVHNTVQYTGCDFAATMITESEKNNAAALEKGQARFLFHIADQLPFSAEFFDKISTINTLYFWEQPHITLLELKRVLKPKGTLVIAIRPKELMLTFPMTVYGFHLYTPQEVQHLLERSGFSVLEIQENQEPDYEFKGQFLKMNHLLFKVFKP